MRVQALLLFAATSLAGCSFSLTGLDPKHRDALLPRAATDVTVSLALPRFAPTPQPDTIDVSAVLHSALSIPQQIESLERAVFITGMLVVALCVVNVLLLLRLVAMRPRATTVMPPTIRTASPACACGAAISPRTKTGRCRTCAVEYRKRNRTTSIGTVRGETTRRLNQASVQT